ncbi:hypothetical protein FACS1894109_01490 [Spirochaetia bacterium]|nr:hypothetical protein FACS1894109_01490 [Spirochaetia bacterium]
MKKLSVVLMILIMTAAASFAAEKSGVVLLKTATLDKKGNTEIRVYLDTTGNGVTDTVLGFEKKVKQSETTPVLQELDTLIKEGSRITFDDANAKKPDFTRIIWHDLIAIDSVSMAQRFPNMYWFPAAFKNAGN